MLIVMDKTKMKKTYLNDDKPILGNLKSLPPYQLITTLFSILPKKLKKSSSQY